MTGSIQMRLRFSERGSPMILASKVGQLQFVLRSFHEPLRRSTRSLAKEIEYQFDVEGDPKWATLSDSTLKRKGGNGSALVRTGKLKRRATQYARWDISKESAGFSLPSSVGYGYFHQTGFTHYMANTEKGTNPNVRARPFARLGQREQKIIAREFDNWFDERMLRVMK